MTNPVKGEASFRIGGTTYTFCFDFGGLCEVEDAARASLPDLLAEMSAGKPKMRTVGAFVYGGLRRYHPEVDFSAAGELLMTDQAVVVEAMAKALETSLPSAEGKAPATAKVRNPRRGTG